MRQLEGRIGADSAAIAMWSWAGVPADTHTHTVLSCLEVAAASRDREPGVSHYLQ